VKPFISNVVSRHRAAPHKNRIAGVGTAEIPYDFIELTECLPPQNERQLGYFGDARFVAFRYEPRAEDVIWCDDRSFGIATGAWQVFFDEIVPLAELYGVNAGNHGRAAQHVLMFDRVRHTAYFAPRESAEAFLSHRSELMAGL